MQGAAGATPERVPPPVTYGRTISEQTVEELYHILIKNMWETKVPPEEASPELLRAAEFVLRGMKEEREAVMYDPDCWIQRAVWFAIDVCEKLLEGRLAEVEYDLFPDKAGPFPAPTFAPPLCPLAPPALKEERERLQSAVQRYANESTEKIDLIYQRAVLEIHLSERYHADRVRVFDERPPLMLLDSVFFLRSGEFGLSEEDEAMYQRLSTFINTLLERHYSGEMAETGVPFLPHVHNVCRWVSYINAEQPVVHIDVAVGGGRTREMLRSTTGVCWVSSNLAGFCARNLMMVVDAENVWDLLCYLNAKYNS
jgi:hypothetical protein